MALGEPHDRDVGESVAGTHVCLECEHRFTPDDADGPVYECDDCAVPFTAADTDAGGNRCPDCNRFAARIAEARCPDCESVDVVAAGERTATPRARSRQHVGVTRTAYLALHPGDWYERYKRAADGRADAAVSA